MSQLPPTLVRQQPTGNRYQPYAASLFPELLTAEADSTTFNAVTTTQPSPTYNAVTTQPPPPTYDDYFDDTVMSSGETVELPSSSTPSSSAHRFLCDTNVEPGLRALVAATPSPRTLASDAVSKSHQVDPADLVTMLKTLQSTVDRIVPRNNDENTAADAVVAAKKKKPSSSSASKKSSACCSRMAQEQRNMSHRITLLEESLVQIRDNGSHATRKVQTEVRALAGEFSRHSTRTHNIYEMVKTNPCIMNHHRK